MVTKAVTEYNHNRPFKCIVLVGDLVNKGPHSAQVIQFVRAQRHWFTVRGNHDDGALRAALSLGLWCDDTEAQQQQLVDLSKSKYSWVDRDEESSSNISLTDEDVQWLAELPYTIRISETTAAGSSTSTSSNGDTIIVHAGLLPGIQLQHQTIPNMVVLRDVLFDEKAKTYIGFENAIRPDETNESQPQPLPWGKVWSGPEHVIFGHDAKRGLQTHRHATGLDTGACYGKQLTGIILPDRTLVSVDAEAIHCPIADRG